MIRAGGIWRILSMAFVLGAASNTLAAEQGAWSVSKSSGEVWMTSTGAQQVSLKQEEVLKPGDTIRTGRNGRVLLMRGEETILVSPNSVIGLPTEKKEGLSTTIVQQAGSILLEVEKRNVKHFEVETPYLAAVVKGTQFRVSVNAASTSVDVIRGQVEVADFKSGQIAQVMPGQVATAFANGKAGLSLSGSGTLNPIEQGKPRASSIERVPVPKTGLSAPRQAANGQVIRAFGHMAASLQPGRAAGVASTRPGVTRITASLGEVRLNFHKVTNGLAHGSTSTPGSSRRTASTDSIWSSRNANASLIGGNSSSQGSSNDAGSGSSNATTGTSATTSAGAIAAAASNSGNGNGNGNASANANGNGLGNGNADANGNANGHGNGHAYGHTK
jgi:FecR protein